MKHGNKLPTITQKNKIIYRIKVSNKLKSEKYDLQFSTIN